MVEGVSVIFCMKIAYIANTRFPSEKAQSDHVMAMCSAFAALGHSVTLYVPNRQSAVHVDPFTYYDIQKTFDVIRVPCLDLVRFGKIGFWIQSVSFIFSLKKILWRYQADIVYSRILHIFLLSGFLGLRVWESHAAHRSLWARLVMKHRLDRIVVLTGAGRDELVRQGFRKDQIFVEPDAVDPRLFDAMPDRENARRDLDIPEGVFLLLYTGKFTTMGMKKGLDEAIESVRRLRASGARVALLAVGGTPEELRTYASSRSSDIRLLGHVPQNDLKRFYAAADAVIMPFPYTEHFAKYMSPLKLFEYLLCKRPIITTDLPSVRDILDESAAFFAKPNDVDSLVSSIRSVMDHPEDAARRSARAGEIGMRHTWGKRASRIVAWLFPS